MTHADLMQVAIEQSGATLPKGFDSWGIKSAHPDLMTTRNFRWASPGGMNSSCSDMDEYNVSACPARPGDGLCVATTWRGMASGGITARTILLVAYREADIVGRDEPAGKLRVGGPVASVALVDGERLIREHGEGADLRGADLWGVNTTPVIELIQDQPDDFVAVLYVAGMSVTLGPDELRALAKDATHARRVLENQEARALWAADIERQLAVFDPDLIVRDEGVTAEAVRRRLVRAGRQDLAAEFSPLVFAEQSNSRRRKKA